jgi:stress response protein YsnF
MAQTVIGIFDYTNEAQAAINRLVNDGFSREKIDISARGSETDANDDDDDTGFGEGISNFFSSLFSDKDEADKYSKVAKHGSIVTVHVESAAQAELAADILDEHGAINIEDRANQYRNSGSSGTTAGTMGTISDSTGTSSETTRTTSDAEGTSIPIIEERMEVGKKVVETGTTRLRSRIVERPVEESVRLRTERIRVERNPVNRPASESEISDFKEGTIEATEHAEVPVVGKDARVVEEVSLNKEVDDREETIRDTVRSTEVDVDKTESDEEIRRRGVQRSTTDSDDDLV